MKMWSSLWFRFSTVGASPLSLSVWGADRRAAKTLQGWSDIFNFAFYISPHFRCALLYIKTMAKTGDQQ